MSSLSWEIQKKPPPKKFGSGRKVVNFASEMSLNDLFFPEFVIKDFLRASYESA
jgi:hypothetical protein